ncbi:MAG: hypothetical protein QHG99_05110 [Methanomicrobiales archaeon]|nr:hypothetical protein [Methanomicrobiales archaeon]
MSTLFGDIGEPDRVRGSTPAVGAQVSPSTARWKGPHGSGGDRRICIASVASH